MILHAFFSATFCLLRIKLIQTEIQCVKWKQIWGNMKKMELECISVSDKKFKEPIFSWRH